nr:unnamed protein product [Callosobruchus analis]
MSSRARPCCVPNCEDRESPRHHIPRPAAVQSIWLQRIGNPKVFGMETSLLRGYTLCELHFSPLCLIESGRLRKNALPTRNLPSTHNEPTDCFIQSPSAALQNVERDLLSALDTKRYLLTAVVENLRPCEAVEPSQEESPPWKVPQRMYLKQAVTRSFYMDDIQQPSTSSAVLPQARPAHGLRVKSLQIRRKKLSPDVHIFYDKLRFLRRQQHQTKLRNLSLKKKGYLIDEEEVIHLYDPPHLLKGVRNSLLCKDLHFIEEGKEKVASWSHIMDLYRIDKEMGKFSQFTKLTDEHVVPDLSMAASLILHQVKVCED